MFNTGAWTARNLCMRAITVLFTEDEDKMHFLQQGVLERIAELVALLYLCSHPDIPQLLLQKGVAKLAANMLSAKYEVVRELYGWS